MRFDKGKSGVLASMMLFGILALVSVGFFAYRMRHAEPVPFAAESREQAADSGALKETAAMANAKGVRNPYQADHEEGEIAPVDTPGIARMDQGTLRRTLESVRSVGDVKAAFSPADLPMLYGVLNDQSAVPLWTRTVYVICALGANEDSLNAVKQFVSRRDDWKKLGDDILFVKASCVSSVYLLGDKGALSYLSELVTDTGARKAVSSWVDGELPKHSWMKEDYVRMLISGAAIALAFAQNDQAFMVVDEEFESILKKPNRTMHETQILLSLSSGMAARDALRELGVEEYLAQHEKNGGAAPLLPVSASLW